MAVSEEEATVGELIEAVYQRFDDATLSYGHGTDNPWDEAVYLVLSVTGYDDDEVSLGLCVTSDQRERIKALAGRRVDERSPLAHLLGECQFMGQRFFVEPGVMVPRSPIGYLLGEPLSAWVAPGITRIVDLCAGVGCLGILAAQRYPMSRVTLVELDPRAAALALKNVALHNLDERVEVIQGDACQWLAGETGQWDLILTNPPYVDAADMQTLPEEYRHEPELGLAAGEDGLALVDAFLPELAARLKPNGVFLCEVGASAPAMQRKYPDLPIHWLKLSEGGEGVFLHASGK
ncbi:MAG: 50S ribosomal protein L3 N(5)-glutamine methyltransferase [Pseudomonadota bacterium]|nr:50S ribosomal protein L3 N(5)-glutamine methyltransferase [Pseudomonadota bacterium]